jgi:transcription antitermination factor NusG
MLLLECRKELRDALKEYLDHAQVEQKHINDRGGFVAQIVPGATPQWHALTVHPAQERIAAAHLSGRRFGVYLPCTTRDIVVKGHKRRYDSPMFPGYLFLFVWDFRSHWERVRACPGVSGYLAVNDAGAAAVIPDGFINRMQAKEAGMMIGSLPRRRRRRRNSPIVDANDEIVSVSCKRWTFDHEELDRPEENHLLHKALGLAS